MPSGAAPFERVQLLAEAVDDLRSISDRSRTVALEVLRLLKLLDEGRLQPQPLRDFAKTGDLTDCGKIVVALEGEPEYWIVVRNVEGTFEVWEVVAVEDRSDDLPYLLAGVRLDRIADPIRRSDTQRRISRIRRFLGGE
jgi:hypothetical protein